MHVWHHKIQVVGIFPALFVLSLHFICQLLLPAIKLYLSTYPKMYSSTCLKVYQSTPLKLHLTTCLPIHAKPQALHP